MDDQIKNEAMKELLGWLHDTGNVAREQAPLACHDILRAGQVQGIIGLSVCGLVLVVLVSTLIFIRGKLKTGCTLLPDDGFGYVLGFVAASFATTGATFGFAYWLYWFLICELAPRAYLLDAFGITK